jgi:hypothetical protein
VRPSSIAVELSLHTGPQIDVFQSSSPAFTLACVLVLACLCDLLCFFLFAGGRRLAMMAPDPIAELEEDPLEAFKMLVHSAGPKSKPSLSSKFVNKMEEIPSLELSPEDPCNLSLLLAEKALIRKFKGLWPRPKTVEAWMDDHWKMLIQGDISLCAVGRVFFCLQFLKERGS